MFFNIFSIFWLSICSMTSYHSLKSDNSSNSFDNEIVEAIESIPSKNAFISGRWLVAVNSDFMDSQFIYSIVENNPSFFYNDSQVGNYLQIDMNCFMCSIDDFNFDDPSSSGNVTTIKHMRFYNTTNGPIQNNTSRYYNYTFYLYDDNYTSYADYSFGLIPNNYNGNYDYDGYMILYYSLPGSMLYSFDREDSRNVNILSFLSALTDPNAYNTGFNNGYTTGFNNGYQSGYGTGYNDGASTDATASTIFTGVLDVALIPVNVFLTILNFDVFGINIAGIVSALLTVSVVVIILRFVLGGKNDDK